MECALVQKGLDIVFVFFSIDFLSCIYTNMVKFFFNQLFYNILPLNTLNYIWYSLVFIYRNPYTCNTIAFIYIVLKYGEEIYAFLMRKQLTTCVYITQQAIKKKKKKRFCYASVYLGRSVELQQMKIFFFIWPKVCWL